MNFKSVAALSFLVLISESAFGKITTDTNKTVYVESTLPAILAAHGMTLIPGSVKFSEHKSLYILPGYTENSDGEMVSFVGKDSHGNYQSGWINLFTDNFPVESSRAMFSRNYTLKEEKDYRITFCNLGMMDPNPVPQSAGEFNLHLTEFSAQEADVGNEPESSGLTVVSDVKERFEWFLNSAKEFYTSSDEEASQSAELMLLLL